MGKLKVMADLYSPNQEPAAGGADYGYGTDRPVQADIPAQPVSRPVIIPFLGAFVSMKQRPRTVAQESIMAIGGPVLGSIAAGLCYLGYLAMPDSNTGQLLRALAYFGFLINLFNLIPLTPLDGGRVTSLLSKWFNVA